MTDRRPSPPLCHDCMRQHIRLPAEVRAQRRAQLLDELADITGPEKPEYWTYAVALFDHLTLARKSTRRFEKGPHPAPSTPHLHDLAVFIRTLERTVIRIAFDVY